MSKHQPVLMLVVPLILPAVWADNWKTHNDAGSKARERSQYQEAEKHYKAAIAEAEKAGSDDVKLATSLNGLALTYADQTKYAEAEPLLRRSLAIFEQKGSNSRELARAYSNLGWLYQQQQKYSEAEPLHQRALKMRKDLLGSDHFEVALTLEDLGFAYQAEGRLAEAEEAFDSSLEIWERNVGAEKKGATLNLANLANRPEIAQSLNNVGVFYYFVGKYREAHPLLKRCLQIQEKLFGPEDERVGDTAQNLARVAQGLEEYTQAEQLFKQAIQISKKKRGAQDPMTAVAMYNLGSLYIAQRRFNEAEPFLEGARTILKGSRQSELQWAGSLNALSTLYLERKDYQAAEAMLRQSLEIQQRETDDSKSPYRVVNLGVVTANLARAYSEHGRFEEAELLFQKTLTYFDTAGLGDHPKLITCLKPYAAMLTKGGRESEAAALESRIRAIRTRLGLVMSGG